MSERYLKEILQKSFNIVCLLGRAPAAEQGCDFYTDDFSFHVEEKYGRTPGEICSSTFYNNRPQEFYSFYRDNILRRRGEPDEVNFTLKRMEDDGRLKGIITRGFFDLSHRAGCRDVIHLSGNIASTTCPHCGKGFGADYILTHTPLPYCDRCGMLIHPGIALSGEMLDSQVMTKAIERITSAEVLLVLGCSLQSTLGSMAHYFNGEKICLVNRVSDYSDQAADCVCIGDIGKILRTAYPPRE